jgi:maleate isomerase
MSTRLTPGAGERAEREYSRLGLFGVAVPQANPIVEPEFAALMPAGTGVLATRLQGSRSESRHRLADYLDNLGSSLEAYDTARLDALGYACTGSTYLVGRDEERRRIDHFSRRYGYPIVTSAQAILSALAHLGATRIALLAPYPQWMVEASHRYWEQCGLTVTAAARTMLDTDDTRHVYRVRSEMVIEAAAGLDLAAADVVLMSGTGMPTLHAIPALARRFGKPVISSNLCLAWALLQVAATPYPAPRADLGETLLGGWAERAVNL